MKYGIEVSPDETPPKGREEGEMREEVRKNPDGEADPTTMASPVHSRLAGMKLEEAADAVVFSIQFYGKTIGEVGLMDQDLSELDWKKFKSYLVSFRGSEVRLLENRFFVDVILGFCFGSAKGWTLTAVTRMLWNIRFT